MRATIKASRCTRSTCVQGSGTDTAAGDRRKQGPPARPREGKVTRALAQMMASADEDSGQNDEDDDFARAPSMGQASKSRTALVDSSDDDDEADMELQPEVAKAKVYLYCVLQSCMPYAMNSVPVC